MVRKIVVSGLFLACLAFHNGRPRALPPVIIGYVAGYNGLLDPNSIQAEQLTHINYAFVNIRQGRAWLENRAVDSINFARLNSLKRRQPHLRLLASVGGWSWSKSFSDLALTDSSRQRFALSCVDLVDRHRLDGLDIDWEYPGLRGDNNPHRPEDRENFTLLLRALRKELDRLEKKRSKTFLLTAAVGAFPDFLQHTEMKEAARFLNFVNLMTYDYSWGRAGHHTHLFASGPDSSEVSADRAVRFFLQAGVPREKLVLGLAFYARGGQVADTAGRGLGQRLERNFAGNNDFSYLKDSLIDRKGFRSYWDEKAQAPYLFNTEEKIFLSYDDERSVGAKADYIRKNGLAGAMFWEYSSDPKGYLLSALYRSFHPEK